MKKAKQMAGLMLAVVIAFLQIGTINVFSADKTSYSEVLYENTFDTGSNADLPEVEHTDFYYPGYNAEFKAALNNYEYASEKAPLNTTVSMESLISAEYNGNMGVRHKKHVGGGTGPIVLFDFRYSDKNKTKTQTPDGLKSGIYTLSFDMSVQGDAYDAYGVSRILANCFHGNTANNLTEFERDNWSIMAGSNSWTYVSGKKNMPLDSDSVYNYKMVINFEEHKICHYLDGELFGTLENFTTPIKYLMITLNGDVDYFDNLKLEKEIVYPVEYEITSKKVGNNFFGDEPVKLTVTARNKTDQEFLDTLKVLLKSPDGNNESVLKIRNISLPAKGSTSFDIELDNLLYGAYLAETESGHGRKSTIRFAKIVEVDKINPEMGVCIHLDGRHTGLSVPTSFDLIEAAGFSEIRTDFKFNVVTDSQNCITGYREWDSGKEDWFLETIDESKEHGIDVLAVLVGMNNMLFSEDEDGGLNTSEEFLDSYYEYCKYLAAKYKEHGIYHFEVGNENNYLTKPATKDSERVFLTNDGKATVKYGDYVYTEPGNWKTKTSIENVNFTVTTSVNSKGQKESFVTLTSLDGQTVYYQNAQCYEPEHGADYVKLLKTAYRGLKAGNPDAVVITSGSSVAYTDKDSTSIRNQSEFFTECLDAISEDLENKFFDVWALHSYHGATGGASPEAKDRWKMRQSFTDTLDYFYDTMEDYGVIEKEAEIGEVIKDVPVWVTETGYENKPDAEHESAAWIIRMIALNFMGNEYGAYHDKFFVYNMFDHGYDENNTHHHYGIMDNWENQYWYNNTAYSAKEMYVTIAQWNKMMNGAKFTDAEIIKDTVEDYTNGKSAETFYRGSYKLEFLKDEGKVVVAWDAAGIGEQIRVTDDEYSKITVYDMYGNTVDESTGDSITVTAGAEPLYIEFTEPTMEITSIDVVKDEQDTPIEESLQPGETVYVKISYNNETGDVKSFVAFGSMYEDKRLKCVNFKNVEAKANTKSAIYVPLTVPEHKNLTIQGNAFDSIKMLTPLY